ncbi:MAG: hypothetical protein AAGH89_01295 [Verrucomicrobiota bacterium]
MSPRTSSILLLLAGIAVVAFLIIAKVRKAPRSSAFIPEAPVLIQPPQKIRINPDQSTTPSPTQPVVGAPQPLSARPISPSAQEASSLSPIATPVASISRAEIALDHLESQLGSPLGGGSQPRNPHADRFGTQPSPLEKEDNVRAGIVFSVDKNTKKVKVEKNTFGRIVDALNARKTDSSE